MDLLAWRFLRSHGVKAMAHWEASPFFTKDGQDVVKATGPHIVSEGWERVTAKETGGASSGGGDVSSSTYKSHARGNWQGAAEPPTIQLY